MYFSLINTVNTEVLWNYTWSPNLPHREPTASVLQINAMLNDTDIIAFYWYNHTEHINTCSGRNAGRLNVQTYFWAKHFYLCTLKVNLSWSDFLFCPIVLGIARFLRFSYITRVHGFWWCYLETGCIRLHIRNTWKPEGGFKANF
jgi:hypothetical protein